MHRDTVNHSPDGPAQAEERIYEPQTQRKALALQCATTLSIYELNYLVAMLTVDKIMTRDVLTVSSDAPLYKAARLMLENKIGGLPVVEDGCVVGIITDSDIFRVLVEELDPRMQPA